MGGNVTSYQENGNPVLLTFGGFAIQPYWLIIVQLLFLQLLQRIFALIMSWKDSREDSGKVAVTQENGKEDKKPKKIVHFYLPLEIAVLRPDEEKIPPPKFSIIDFILSLISVAHFVYACYRQTLCSSVRNYSAWGCYNAFGYRLYNYVLPSVISVLVQSIVEVVNNYKANQRQKQLGEGTTICRGCNWFLLLLTIIMNVVICIVFVPFFITNALPMFIGFIWLLVPLLCALILVYASFITGVINAIKKCEGCHLRYCFTFFGAHCAVGLQVFGCLVMSMAYNYSQYAYFGGGYLRVIQYEFQSRDTGQWAATLTNDSTLLTHNILSSF